MDWTSLENLLPTADGGEGGGGGGREGGERDTAREMIDSALGKTLTVTAKNGGDLCALYSKCVDSVNDSSQVPLSAIYLSINLPISLSIYSSISLSIYLSFQIDT